MNKLMNLWTKATHVADRVSAIGPLLMRVALASVFIPSGWGKLHNLDGVTQFFTNLGIPAPGFNAILVGTTELLGGIFILLGLATRLWAIPLIITMVVAILTAMLDEVESVFGFFALDEFVYIAGFVWLLLRGAGSLSLDHVVARLLQRRSGQGFLSGQPDRT